MPQPRVFERWFNALPTIDPETLHKEDQNCVICLLSYSSPSPASLQQNENPASENPIRLPCGHVIGQECLRKWLSPAPAGGNSNKCPLCRHHLFDAWPSNLAISADELMQRLPRYRHIPDPATHEADHAAPAVDPRDLELYRAFATQFVRYNDRGRTDRAVPPDLLERVQERLRQQRQRNGETAHGFSRLRETEERTRAVPPHDPEGIQERSRRQRQRNEELAQRLVLIRNEHRLLEIRERRRAIAREQAELERQHAELEDQNRALRGRLGHHDEPRRDTAGSGQIDLGLSGLRERLNEVDYERWRHRNLGQRHHRGR
ncbi:MAG: Ubiquitin-protein ligase [Heterodermia speciosa]|uniref:Ubiquitin-protein ligase n=1 Tax=Heterodermia speciosa TaxID=116794 RepID=A0A8H3FG00_9LECA|nr:MAG: Ubiquitin-protein ligase [Heterodermia speciosa]